MCLLQVAQKSCDARKKEEKSGRGLASGCRSSHAPSITWVRRTAPWGFRSCFRCARDHSPGHAACLLQKQSDMILMPVLCLRCHTNPVMKGDKTKVHI